MNGIVTLCLAFLIASVGADIQAKAQSFAEGQYSSLGHWADSDCDDFCSALRRVLSDRFDDFAEIQDREITTDSQRNDNIRQATVKVTLPGAKGCWVFRWNSHPITYFCTFVDFDDGLSRDDVLLKQRALANRMRDAVPDGWLVWDRHHERLEHEILIGPTGRDDEEIINLQVTKIGGHEVGFDGEATDTPEKFSLTMYIGYNWGSHKRTLPDR